LPPLAITDLVPGVTDGQDQLGSRRRDEFQICLAATDNFLFSFLATFFVPKGRKLIAVGERLCAKPTEKNASRDSDREISLTLFEGPRYVF
jgi:hypothetical protein